MVINISYLFGVAKSNRVFNPFKGLQIPLPVGAITIHDLQLSCRVFFSYKYLPVVIDPVMKFSMDLASGTTTLIGSINGTLQNGASVIPGVTGTAFYTGATGGCLDLGIHSGGCIHYPDDCPNGISIALWLKIYELPVPGTFLVIIDNGGCWPDSAGYCLFLMHDGIGFTARHELPGYMEMIAIVPLHQWFHIAVSHKETNTSIFVNGCTGETIYNVQWERSSATTEQIRRFMCGCLENGQGPAHVAMDEMDIWYTALSEDDIWQLYLNVVAR